MDLPPDTGLRGHSRRGLWAKEALTLLVKVRNYQEASGMDGVPGDRSDVKAFDLLKKIVTVVPAA